MKLKTRICVLLAIMTLYATFAAVYLDGEYNSSLQTITALEKQIDTLEKKSAEMAAYKAQVDSLTQQISALQTQSVSRMDKEE